MPFYDRQPYIQPLHQIIKEVMSGDIRVPRFQRPGTEITWRPEQRGDLLDSLYRGFPVGTILLWSTPTTIPTFDVVGGFRIPPEPTGASRRPQRLLLDGHQRLSTLVQILGAGLVDELAIAGIQVTLEPNHAADKETWVFDLNDDQTIRERFICLKRDVQPTQTQLPLSLVMNRVAVNRWIRKHDPDLTPAQEQAVDAVRDRLREYNMPVAVLAADSLEEATESFKRVNSSATPMDDFHMVAALAYEADNDPTEQFVQARAEYLAPIGWGDIANIDILRVVMGIQERRNPAKLDVAELAKRMRNDRNLIERGFQIVAAAAQLLGACGIHGPSALPYSWQIIVLSVYLGRTYSGTIPPSFDEAIRAGVARWFWLTTYGEVFSGLNSALVDRTLAALHDLIEGKDWSKMTRDVTPEVRPVASFDYRTARSKACALLMARLQDQGDVHGSAHRALTTGGGALQVLNVRGRRSRWWHLAVVTPEYGVVAMRDALRRRERNEAPSVDDSTLLERLGVPSDATGNIEELLAARRDRLLDVEKDFVTKLGLTWTQTE